MTDHPRSYTVRRLNPFLGVVAVVETPDARALSSDGETWQLQVLAERPEHTWGSPNRGATVRQFFRFGRWCPAEGMTGVPANPVFDVKAMLGAAQRLSETVRAQLPSLPFPLADRFERWLLDRDDRPLALLASTVDRALLTGVGDAGWVATPTTGTAFVSPSLEGAGVGAVSGGSQRRHAEILEARVTEAASSPPRRQWFERLPDGRGRGLGDASPEALAGRELPAEAFPITGLRTEWPETATGTLVAEYHDWAAARLLTLPGLPDGARARLEEAARSQALQVEALHRLYPRIIRQAWIDAARVEARLRHAAEPT